jgi:acyl-CoA dehydrogenase
MDFDFSDDQKQLKDHARRFLEKTSSRDVVRAVLDAGHTHDPELWAGLIELGFTATAIPEEYGGLGLGYLELCVVAEELGRSLAPVPFSSSVYLAAEFLLASGSEAQKEQWLPLIASGKAVGTVALTEGSDAGDLKVHAKVSKGKLSGVKIPVPDGMIADFAIVSALADDDHPQLFIADLAAEGVSREAVSTIDPTRGQGRLSFGETPVEPLGTGDSSTIESVFDRAAVLFAFEQVGGADRALEMARDYSLERRAFGRQIGSFQALKHMMADMYVSATLARSNAYYAAWALSVDSAELSQAAASARVSATQAFRHCAKNSIQVHGGMGFTWESDCHLYYRRSNLLAVNLRGPMYWEDRLIECIKTSGVV